MIAFDWSKMAQAAVIPVVVVSACGLLCLALYNRLAAVVARLRSFERERIEASVQLARLRREEGDVPEETMRYTAMLDSLVKQIEGVTARAHLVRQALVLLLSAICCFMLCSFVTGLSVLWPPVMYLGVLLFSMGVWLMLFALFCAIRELRHALDPVLLETEAVEELSDALAGTAFEDAAD